MLGNHIKIVGVGTANKDGHSKEVVVIRRIMESHCEDKDAYTPEMFAHIFCHILMDSRSYFNTFGTAPHSNLGVLRESIRSFVVPVPMNCPLQELIGGTKRRRWEGQREEPEPIPHHRPEKIGKGGKNTNWMRELQKNGKYRRERSPNFQIEDTFAILPSLKLSDIRMGRPGTCQDFHLFGECKREGCSSMHKDTDAPEKRKRAAVNALNAFANTLR